MGEAVGAASGLDAGVSGEQFAAAGRVAVTRTGSFRQHSRGDQAGVRLDHNVGLEPADLLLPGLVRMACIRVKSGDHPVRSHPAGDPPPPIGAIESLGRFNILPLETCMKLSTICCLWGGIGPIFGWS